MASFRDVFRAGLVHFHGGGRAADLAVSHGIDFVLSCSAAISVSACSNCCLLRSFCDILACALFVPATLSAACDARPALRADLAVDSCMMSFKSSLEAGIFGDAHGALVDLDGSGLDGGDFVWGLVS